jgi:hypothetical protein
MPLSGQTQRDIISSITNCKKQPEVISEEVIDTEMSEESQTTNEDIVMSFLGESLSHTLNEDCTDEEKEVAIVEAVTNLNILTALVNEYFEITD